MSETIPNANGQRKRILVLDDEPEVLKVNAETLQAAGFLVDMAQDGESGWQALCTANYDLLVTDNSMPRLSGLELVSRLRKTGNRMPAILVSGSYRFEEDPELELSATLQKPYHLYELVSTARRALNGLKQAPAPRPSSTIFSMRHRPLALPPHG